MIKDLEKVTVLEVKEVAFNNVILLGIKTDDGVYTSVRNICDDLGLDIGSQLKKIKKHKILLKGIRSIALPSNGGIQETTCINVESLPFWLITISPTKVKKDIQDTLLLFLEKAHKLLAAAFIDKELEVKKEIVSPGPIVQLNNFSAFEVLEQMFKSIKENKTEILQIKENSISAQKTADYALSKILEIEENKKKVENEHQNFEYSGQLAYEVETRKKISRLVKLYIYNKYKTPTGEDYVEAYRMLYVEVYNRLGKDLKTRSENQSKKYNKKISGLEVAEQLGIIKEVFDIASVVFHHSKVA